MMRTYSYNWWNVCVYYGRFMNIWTISWLGKIMRKRSCRLPCIITTSEYFIMYRQPATVLQTGNRRPCRSLWVAEVMTNHWSSVYGTHFYRLFCCRDFTLNYNISFNSFFVNFIVCISSCNSLWLQYIINWCINYCFCCSVFITCFVVTMCEWLSFPVQKCSIIV